MSEVNSQSRNKRSGQYEFAPRVVLFATDFSAPCENAWSYALAFAKRYKSKLLLAHVIAPSVYAAVPAELVSSAKEQVKRNAEAQLARLQQSNGGTERLNCELLLREGEVAEVLLRLIHDYRVDLLVAGTRGHGGTERLLLGSVAEKLFRQARCPVLVVPERASSDQEPAIHRILCPIDFSPDSPTALAYASSIACHYKAQLIVMHVVEEPTSADKMAELTRTAEERLRRLLNSDQNLPFESQIEIAFGVPTERISRIANDYQPDLIILSPHSAAAAIAHERERTAYRIIRWSRCPVLTIPRSESPGAKT